MRQTYQAGHVFEDSRRKGLWYVKYRIKGKQTTKRLGRCGSEKNARKKAATILLDVNEQNTVGQRITLGQLVRTYKKSDRFPARFSTKAAYTSYLDFQIVPKWGTKRLEDIKAKDVEAWLKSLRLAGKTKSHLKMLMHLLFQFAAHEEHWTELNPMRTVRVQGASKRAREPLTLTTDECHQVISGIRREPFKTMAITAMCLGLRYSELIGLKWGDVDWIGSKVHIRRGVVNSHVDETKTADSNKAIPIAGALMEVWKHWRTLAEFKAEGDWMFASPQMAGTQPYCHTWARKELIKASTLTGLGWHTFRHSYRAWLNSVGATPGVQKDLMRHSDIRTTLNVYGHSLTEEMRETHSKVVGLVLRKELRQ
jgi:integrase